MQLNKTTLFDNTAKLSYSLKQPIIFSSGITQITGENGVGKTRFLEGVLLKEAKEQGYKVLYFGQDIENQILTFNLISLVKEFIDTLKKQGNFFKAILFNDDSHNQINLDFNQDSTLNPTSRDKKKFIVAESKKFSSVDIVALDEVDKYFENNNDFKKFIETINAKHIFIISHILQDRFNTLNLEGKNGEVLVDYTSN